MTACTGQKDRSKVHAHHVMIRLWQLLLDAVLSYQPVATEAAAVSLLGN